MDSTRSMDSSILTRAAGLLGAGVLGGALALGGATLLDVGAKTTTVREVVNAPGRSDSPVVIQRGGGLTINQIYRRASPGVVQVTSTSIAESPPDPFFGNPFGQPGEQEQRKLGSGFVWDKAGHIVTNYHVVEDAESVEVSFSNNESMKARIVGTDPSTDIAVLKVDARSRALTPIALGNSDGVQVGDAVVAIGNPFGLERTLTAGVVSALQREISAPNLYAIDHVIQTDAPINQGNSGGPLLNAQGQVIGVNAQISTGGTGAQGNVGIGFAIPINTVKDVASQLIENGRVEHALLGVTVKEITPEAARLFRLPVSRGLLIQDVTSGSAADEAGLKGGTSEVVVDGTSWKLGGDIILRADGASLTDSSRLRDAISAKRPGDRIELEIYRGDDRRTLEVKLGRQPSVQPS